MLFAMYNCMQPEDVINHYEEKVVGASPDSVLRDEVQTMSRIEGVASLQKLLPQIRKAYSFVRKCAAGRKKDHVNASLTLVVSGLAYLALPNDIVPDFIPAVGWLDDAMVLNWIFNRVASDLQFREEKPKSETRSHDVNVN